MEGIDIKRVINIIAVIAFTYLYVHYIAPIINAYTHSFILSWGIALLLIGIWGNLVKLTLLKSVFYTDSYKIENYFWIVIGAILILVGVLKVVLYY
ncbi:MAG: hypothetical protein K0R84_328 [Clostridia bacterium]|jgi:hypothetical protein|nr:hypothetical protein [Clostridia bacterium]